VVGKILKEVIKDSPVEGCPVVVSERPVLFYRQEVVRIDIF